MKASTTKSWTRAYVLESGDLELLCSRLSGKLSGITFDTENKDGIKREYQTLDELLAFDNPPKKDIRVLRIKSFSSGNSVFLRFDKDSMKNVLLILDGTEDYVMAMNEEVESRLAAMKPWYGPLANPFFLPVVLILVGLFPLIKSLLAYYQGRIPAEAFIPPSYVIALIVIVVGWVVAHLLSKLILAIFPMGVIAIGQGAKRHKDKEVFRTVFVVSFIISVIAGVITSFIV